MDPEITYSTLLVHPNDGIEHHSPSSHMEVALVPTNRPRPSSPRKGVENRVTILWWPERGTEEPRWDPQSKVNAQLFPSSKTPFMGALMGVLASKFRKLCSTIDKWPILSVPIKKLCWAV